MVKTDGTLEETTATMRQFLALNAKDLEYVLKGMRRNTLQYLSENGKPADVKDAEARFKDIEPLVEKMNEYCMKNFQEPFYLAIVHKKFDMSAFTNTTSAGNVSTASVVGDCDDFVSFPNRYGLGFTLRPVFPNGSVGLISRFEGGGCQFHIQGYSRAIRNIAITPTTSLLVAASPGQVVFDTDFSLFVDVTAAAASGLTGPLLIQFLPIKRR